jgi:hypothetical protein
MHSGQHTEGNDMLSTVTTARSTFAAALAALAIAAVPAAPAHAWGDKEQGFVAGVAAALIVDELLKQNRKARTVRPAPVYNFVDPNPGVSTTSIYRTTAARTFNSYPLSERKAIQRQLRAWGYYHGGIDGVFGPGTYSAVTAYARDEGQSGKLSTNAGAFGVYDGLIFRTRS